MTTWDLAVVGAGPAGAATAIGALAVDPSLRVVLLDRADFPRDKSCGDGIAPEVIDLLEEAGVTSVVKDRTSISRLQLHRGSIGVEREMSRPTWVVPRKVFDERLVSAALAAGATLLRHRVREIVKDPTPVVDDTHAAGILVGADGAHSSVRRALGLSPGPMAIALRGYAPTPPSRAGVQLIAFDTRRQPAYAWSFDRGDGLSNIGYGELPGRGGDRTTRAQLLERLDALLPGVADGARDWKGHQLPLSNGRFRPQPGRVLLVGDAAGLVNPMTGEGIYYAVATGLAAGRAAAAALAAGVPATAGDRYSAAVRPLLDTHLRHVALAARLCHYGPVIDAGLRASAADQRPFDDLVQLGLARGLITPVMARGMVRELATKALGRRGARIIPGDSKETTLCES